MSQSVTSNNSAFAKCSGKQILHDSIKITYKSSFLACHFFEFCWQIPQISVETYYFAVTVHNSFSDIFNWDRWTFWHWRYFCHKFRNLGATVRKQSGRTEVTDPEIEIQNDPGLFDEDIFSDFFYWVSLAPPHPRIKQNSLYRRNETAKAKILTLVMWTSFPIKTYHWVWGISPNTKGYNDLSSILRQDWYTKINILVHRWRYVNRQFCMRICYPCNECIFLTLWK